MEINISGILLPVEKEHYSSIKDIFPSLSQADIDRITEEITQTTLQTEKHFAQHDEYTAGNQLIAGYLRALRWDGELPDAILFKLYSIGVYIGYKTFQILNNSEVE